MTGTLDGLTTFLDRHGKTALIEVAGAKGSTPREKGAWMLVSPDAIFGTIGGGQLEYMAIDRARALLDGHEAASATFPYRSARQSGNAAAAGWNCRSGRSTPRSPRGWE
jgi:xanthine dehydrogenase accessory factor